MSQSHFQIAGRAIGPGQPCYIIAEMSANHGGRIEEALRLIDEAKAAGADAVKMQTYTADTITLDVDTPLFRIDSGTLWDGRTLHDLYQEASMPWEWQPHLMAHARDIGITLFSSPFDPTAVAFLESLNVPAYKIASFELVDIPLIECVARTGKPIIMSTGMGTQEEIAEAVGAVRANGDSSILLLKCTSAYPATADQLNLGAIPRMVEVFGTPVGLSDHTCGIVAPVAAAALGACVIEKHFTHSRDDGGPDAAFSLEPHEFAAMVAAVRDTEAALGATIGAATEKEQASRVFRKSLFVARDMVAGELFTPENLRSVRPSHGLHPRYLQSVLGRPAAFDIAAGSPLRWEDIVMSEKVENP